MSDTVRLRGYRFGERRRSGLFGTLPPTLCAVGVVALLAAWLAISGFVPFPLAIVVVAVCGWLWFGKLHQRPAHEILPALGLWWWRKLRSRNRWFRPVALIVDGDRPAAPVRDRGQRKTRVEQRDENRQAVHANDARQLRNRQQGHHRVAERNPREAADQDAAQVFHRHPRGGCQP